MLRAVSGKMSSAVAPLALSFETILREMSVFAAVVTVAVVGVGVLSDHVLALVGGFVGLDLSG